LVRIEDAFLRSIRPGRAGGRTLGLILDGTGVHFDAASPSRLEHVLAQADLTDPNLMQRARDGMIRLQGSDLSKYNIHDSKIDPPNPGYVLVVDQTRGDASIRHAGATAATFAQMLAAARLDNPDARIIIKTHPETAMGLRPGHFGTADGEVMTAPISPWRLLKGAASVYTVSSQLGFEAILAGHRPHVFGLPFYAGWGLTADRQPIARRGRVLTAEQLFTAAMLIAPLWYDPCRDQLSSFEQTLDQLEAETRAFREDRFGHVALGMRMWKRGRLQAVFGREKPLVFARNERQAVTWATAKKAGLLVWAGKEPPDLAASAGFSRPVLRIEDGFLRSRGLGAELVPPLSLVTDDRGIYYDPTRPSKLEALILGPVPPGGLARAASLREALVASGVTKYNLSGSSLPDLPAGRRILVPGQVEDDASIRLGAGKVRSNLDLLRTARIANPSAVLIYKPHPDVVAGLRPGTIAANDLEGLADVVLENPDTASLLGQVDEVWTITSGLGFEALLRGKAITCLGAPFYAGWGLTRDLGVVPERRKTAPDGTPLPRPSLDTLVHSALIAYPRYFDPVSNLPCPPEVVLDRLASGRIQHRSLVNRLLAKAQGRLASHAALWRS
jgi:capsular polysaccharide export protein